MDKVPSISDKKDLDTMHLEEAHLQDEVRSIEIPKTDVAPAYGIDEAHQKRVMYLYNPLPTTTLQPG